MTITLLLIHGQEDDEDYEEHRKNYENEEAASTAWKQLCRDFIQGDSEDVVAGVYFHDTDTEIEFESQFCEFTWDDVMETYNELVESDEPYARI